MKEAIGTASLTNIILVFVGIFIALYVGSISYSKGFKVRNRIINILEKHRGYTDAAVAEIDENLISIGYPIAESNCKDRENGTLLTKKSAYNYCIYQYDATKKGTYYGVTVFIHFDFPIIGDWISIPIYGESRIIFDKSSIEG